MLSSFGGMATLLCSLSPVSGDRHPGHPARPGPGHCGLSGSRIRRGSDLSTVKFRISPGTCGPTALSRPVVPELPAPECL
eukprot:234959-Hanusia_phi.AAC.1